MMDLVTETTTGKRKSTSQLLRRVAECLYRHVETDRYYAKKKHRGKIKTEVRTEEGHPGTEVAAAKRLLREWLEKLDMTQVESETLAQPVEKPRTRCSGHEDKTKKTSNGSSTPFKRRSVRSSRHR